MIFSYRMTWTAEDPADNTGNWFGTFIHRLSCFC